MTYNMHWYVTIKKITYKSTNTNDFTWFGLFHKDIKIITKTYLTMMLDVKPLT